MGVPKTKTEMTVEQLQHCAVEMQQLAATLDAVAAKMEDNDVKQITVTNHATFMSGIDRVARFCGAVNRGWREETMG